MTRMKDIPGSAAQPSDPLSAFNVPGNMFNPLESFNQAWRTMQGASPLPPTMSVAELEKRDPALPLPVTGSLAALTAAGVATMPASGFWTLTVPLAIAVVRRRRARRPGRSAR